MKVYLVMINDRHTDPDAEVYATADGAIAHAEEFVADMLRRTPWEDDDPEPTPEGWLWYRRYSVEGDAVWVIEKELNNG